MKTLNDFYNIHCGLDPHQMDYYSKLALRQEEVARDTAVYRFFLNNLVTYDTCSLREVCHLTGVLETYGSGYGGTISGIGSLAQALIRLVIREDPLAVEYLGEEKFKFILNQRKSGFESVLGTKLYNQIREETKHEKMRAKHEKMRADTIRYNRFAMLELEEGPIIEARGIEISDRFATLELD